VSKDNSSSECRVWMSEESERTVRSKWRNGALFYMILAIVILGVTTGIAVKLEAYLWHISLAALGGVLSGWCMHIAYVYKENFSILEFMKRDVQRSEKEKARAQQASHNERLVLH